MRVTRIGVLTGGGDCPGLNAVLRGLVLRAEQLGCEVIGIEDGFEGLLPETEPTARVLTPREVMPLLAQGGTILGTTNRGNPFRYPDGHGGTRDRSDDVVRAIEDLRIQRLVTIGGDGTQTIAFGIMKKGVPVIGVPKTIDNDLASTYRTFGFSSAVQVVSEALDRLRTTAESHERIMVLEVMGRNAGWIALHSGLAGGAHVILLPEVPYHPSIVGRALADRARRGAGYGLVVVAEGAAPLGETAPMQVPVGAHAGRGAPQLGGAGIRAAQLLAETVPELEFRVTVLGHLQRGGSPIAEDRILATRFGVEAANAACQGEGGVLVSWQPPNIVTVALSEEVSQPRLVDPACQLMQHARGVGICFGDEPAVPS